VDIMRRRKEWFERMSDAYVVLWWVPKGHRPSVSEVSEKLELLRSKGSTGRRTPPPSLWRVPAVSRRKAIRPGI
jgi:uncharacterized protein DUF3291